MLHERLSLVHYRKELLPCSFERRRLHVARRSPRSTLLKCTHARGAADYAGRQIGDTVRVLTAAGRLATSLYTALGQPHRLHWSLP